MLTRQQLAAKSAAMSYFAATAGASGFSLTPTSGAPAAVLPQGNVVGVGIGAGDSDNAVVRVYVTAKEALAPIPPRFGDLSSQVVEVGDVVATAILTTGQRFGRNRPTSCGVSIGHPNVTVGTLGCRVKKDGHRYVLSNNHVLADTNAASLGDVIIQPGTHDGGTVALDRIAVLSDFLALDFTGGANDFDAAIARLDALADVESDIIDIGAPSAPAQPVLYQSVRKHGRTTGHTVGVVSDASVSLWVNYGLRRAWFQDQIAIQGVGAAHFSSGGDSGSLVVDAVTLAPVALLFAGSSSGVTFASPISPVLSHFGIQID